MTRNLQMVFVGAAAAAAIALGLGIYEFQGPQSKVDPPPSAGSASGLGTFATGSLAGLLVHDSRAAMPDVGFQDVAGAPLSLSKWKGRVALVNLWATWCGPCRKEMPALAALQKDLGSKDFEVVAVSLDMKGIPASSAFLKETGAEALALYADPKGELLNTLNAPGLPVTILVDRQGREAARMVGPAEWNGPEAQALIKAALAEK